MVVDDGVAPIPVGRVRDQETRGKIKSGAKADVAVVGAAVAQRAISVDAAHDVRARGVRGTQPPVPRLRGCQAAVGILGVADGRRRRLGDAVARGVEQG